MHEQFKKYHQEKKIDLFFAQSAKIHKRIWKAYNNEMMYQILADAHDRLALFIGGYADQYYSQDLVNQSYKDHSDLMDAIEKRDAELASEILANHWDYSARDSQQKGGKESDNK